MLKVHELVDFLTEGGFQPELIEDDEEIAIACPLCSDDRNRLNISTEHGGWICFHCHEEGGLHRLLMAVCDLSGSAAFEQMRKLVSNDDDWSEDPFERKRVVEKKPTDAILRLPDSFVTLDKSTPLVFRKYLAKRHVSTELAASYGIGYAVSGRYGGRVIVPVVNDGHLFTYVARTVKTNCPSCEEPIDDCTCRPHKFPKVLTPTKKDGANPNLTLFNLDSIRKTRPRTVYVFEGIYDCLRLPQSSVALLGSSASDTQIALLASLSLASNIVLALDPDEAGYKGMLKIAKSLTSEMVLCNIAMLPEGQDPGEVQDVTELMAGLNNAKRFIL